MSSPARRLTPDETTWHKLGGPGGNGEPKPLPHQGQVAREGSGQPLKFCPPEGTSHRRGREKRRFGSFAAVSKGTRRRGGGILLLRGCSFLFAQKGTKNARGLSPRSASTPVANPGPRYGGRFPGSCSSHPARAGQGIAVLPAPLPLAGQCRESCPAGRWKRAW